MSGDYDPQADGIGSYYAAIEAKREAGWTAVKKDVTIGDCRLLKGDCLEILPLIKNVDAILVDPPFGTTQCAWDAVIPFREMWSALHPLMASGAPVVVFGCEPFSSLLRVSNLDQYKYDWVWHKPKGTGFLNAKKRPMRCHEKISVFSAGRPPYFPQKTTGHERKTTFRGKHLQTDVYGHMAGDYSYDSTERYPRDVLTFSSDTQSSSLHPTQKPVSLLEYLVLTYTEPGQTVLDFTMGSGTTGVACVNTGRRFIGIEKDEHDTSYFEIACDRIREAQSRVQQDIFSHPSATSQTASAGASNPLTSVPAHNSEAA